MNSVLPEPEILLDPPPTPEIPLPKGWTALTLQTILHVIAFARIVILNAHNWPDGPGSAMFFDPGMKSEGGATDFASDLGGGNVRREHEIDGGGADVVGVMNAWHGVFGGKKARRI